MTNMCASVQHIFPTNAVFYRSDTDATDGIPLLSHSSGCVSLKLLTDANSHPSLPIPLHLPLLYTVCLLQCQNIEVPVN